MISLVSSEPAQAPEAPAPTFAPLVASQADCMSEIRVRIRALSHSDPRRPLLQALDPMLVRALCAPLRNREDRLRQLVDDIMDYKVVKLGEMLVVIPSDLHSLSVALNAEAVSQRKRDDRLKKSVVTGQLERGRV